MYGQGRGSRRRWVGWRGRHLDLALLITGLLVAAPLWAANAACCSGKGVCLQVLGSGGPEVEDGRASSSYLIWLDGRARVLVDAGGGSSLRFAQSGARFADLDVVLFTHFHVDHSAAFPVLIKSSFFSGRDRELPVYGPQGNRIMPGTRTFLARLFGEEAGVYRYLSDYLDAQPAADYRLRPHSLAIAGRSVMAAYVGQRLRASSVPVHHGPIPALAWRVDIDGVSIVFSGDMNGDYHTLEKLAVGADILVAHNAVPEGASGVARNLHMPPSVIGQIAATAGVRQLVLSHRMRRTLGREAQTRSVIRRYYPAADTGQDKRSIRFADDLDCFRP